MFFTFVGGLFWRSSPFSSFVKNKELIGAWVYFWAFYFVPLVCISGFVPVPYCLDDCRFVEYTLFGNSE